MIKLTLPIYGVVSAKKQNESLTLNWYRNAHYQSANAAKKRFKKMILPQLLALDSIETPIKIRYKYYAKRKGTDLDNFCSVSRKFLQDSLVETGLIDDDNCEFIIKSSEEYAGIDRQNPRIEVFID
jgi:Holliday junction resolvase RusA-like endonuclease